MALSLSAMRKALWFYWLCVRRAWSGSVEKANAWATLIGAGALWIALTVFGFEPIIPEKLGENILFTVLCFVVAWLFFFVVRLLKAPSQLYWETDDKVKELSARLVPKIDVSLNASNGGVNTLQIKPLQKWIQITVKSASDAPLFDCEVWVNRIQRMEGSEVVAELIQESVIALWSQISELENKRINIPSKVPQAANLFSLVDTETPRLYPQFHHVKHYLLDEIQKPGHYRIETVVSAKHCKSEKTHFLLDWSGKFENVKISELRES